MDMKEIDLSKSVYSLCKQYPELAEILAGIGFKDITNPGMLASVGRIMTIPKGAALKNLDINTIKTQLSEHGFTVKE